MREKPPQSLTDGSRARYGMPVPPAPARLSGIVEMERCKKTLKSGFGYLVGQPARSIRRGEIEAGDVQMTRVDHDAKPAGVRPDGANNAAYLVDRLPKLRALTAVFEKDARPRL